jgi:hypothetical protein
MTEPKALPNGKPPAQQLDHLVRVFGRNDGKASWSAASGTMSVLQEHGLPTPSHPFVSVRAHRFVRHEDGFIEELVAAILVLEKDGASLLREHVDEQGNRHEVKPFPYRQSYFHCPLTGTHRVDQASGKITVGSIWSAQHLAPFAIEWTAATGIGWATYVNPHERMGGTWSDCYRFRFPLAEIEGDQPFVSSTYGYLGESPAAPWLGRKGAQSLWQAFGVKCISPEAIPSAIRRPVAMAVPELIDPDIFSRSN